MLVLTKKAKRVLDLYLDGLTYKEMSKILGVTDRACIWHMHVASLKNKLSHEELAYTYAREI